MNGLQEDAQTGVPKPVVGLRGKIAALSDSLFIDREIFVRGDGKVRYLKLSRRLQQRGALAGLGAAACLLLAGGGLLWQQNRIGDQEAQLDQARAAYTGLMSEVGRYQRQFASISDELDESQGLLQDLIASAPGEDKIQNPAGNVVDGLKRIGEARTALRQKLSEFDGDMQRIVDRNVSLSLRLTLLNTVLQDSRQYQSVIEAQRKALHAQLKTGAKKFDQMLADNRDLKAKLAQVQDSLDSSDTKLRALDRERAKLLRQVGGLQERLAARAQRQAELQDYVAQLTSNADSRFAERAGLLAERETLRQRVAAAEARLTQLQMAQQSLFARLRERTDLTIGSIEQTLAMTGLDVEAMIARVAKVKPASGGPFLAVAEGSAEDTGEGIGDGGALLAVTPNELAPTDVAITDAALTDAAITGPVALFDVQMTRWEAMQRLLAAMPLTAPLDHYWVSSPYGNRRDPVNGRSARHAGIDLSGQLGTRVMSTSPGRVTFAGWNGNYGRMIEIDHGYGLKTRYAHLRRIDVEVGDHIGHREVIGLLGSSGRSTGPHVHYEIVLDGKPQDPMNFLKAGRYVFKG